MSMVSPPFHKLAHPLDKRLVRKAASVARWERIYCRMRSLGDRSPDLRLSAFSKEAIGEKVREETDTVAEKEW
ncbi:unnamed protein product [Linum trigynum]|uniref:Uncharacterized protein n=1 Tax=Linum trigynum TaxID=586398 RepID=A0AAV2C8N4_9ROSI